MYQPITGVGTGAAPVVNLPWPFLDKAHVSATVNGTPVPFAWTGPSQVTFASTVTGGAAWEVSRATPAEPALVSFTDGAILTEDDLEKAQAQSLYRLQELSQPTVNGAPLAASSGASLIGWIASGIGAVIRTIRDKLRERVSVKDFGAVGNGTTDDTAAIQAAVNSLTSGGRLYFPEGTYKITTAISLPAVDGITFAGANRNKTSIVQATLTENIINTGTGAFFRLTGLRLTWSGTASAGTKAIYSQGNYAHLSDFMFDGGDVGIHFKTGVGQKATNFDGFNSSGSLVLVEALNDVFMSRFVLNAGNTTNAAQGVIRLKDKAEAVIMTDGDVLFGAYSIKTDAASYTQGNRPAHCKFTNIYFDSSANGGLINNSVEFDFNNCSISNRPNHGMVLGVVDGVRFNGGAAIQCGMNGVLVGASAVRVTFNGFAARGNSYTTPNTYDGIAFAAGATDFMVTGNTLGGSIGFGTQRYGVSVATGASDRYIIADNLVTGNGTGGVLDGGAGTNKRVANNY